MAYRYIETDIHILLTLLVPIRSRGLHAKINMNTAEYRWT